MLRGVSYDITCRAKKGGRVSVSDGLRGKALGTLRLAPAQTWTKAQIHVPLENGIGGLFFFFRGSGTEELLNFTFISCYQLPREGEPA